MQIKNMKKTLSGHKGSVMFDVLIALIFFALIAMSSYKLLFQSVGTDDDVKSNAEEIEVVNNIGEEMRALRSCPVDKNLKRKYTFTCNPNSFEEDDLKGIYKIKVDVYEKKADGSGYKDTALKTLNIRTFIQ